MMTMKSPSNKVLLTYLFFLAFNTCNWLTPTECSTFRWRFETDGCKTLTSSEKKAASEINWSSNQCWQELGTGNVNVQPQRGDDVVFHMSSELLSSPYYLILTIDTNISIRNVMVFGNGDQCCDSIYGYSSIYEFDGPQISFFTLKIAAHGALNVAKISSNTSCICYFSLKIYEFGNLNLQDHSQIDAVVFNWGTVSAHTPGIEFGVFTLILGCNKSLSHIWNVSVYSFPREKFPVKVCTWNMRASSTSPCRPLSSKLVDSYGVAQCLYPFMDIFNNVAIKVCRTDFWNDLDDHDSISKILDIRSLAFPSIILACRNGVKMSSSALRAEHKNSAILFASNSGNITGYNCSVHSFFSKIIFASPCSLNAIFVMCNISSYTETQVLRKIGFHAPVRISGQMNISNSSYVSRIEKMSTDCNILTFYDSLQLLNSSVIHVEDAFISKNNACSIIHVDQARNHVFHIGKVVIVAKKCQNQNSSHTILSVSNCAASTTVGTIQLELLPGTDSICTSSNIPSSLIIWSCSTDLITSGACQKNGSYMLLSYMGCDAGQERVLDDCIDCKMGMYSKYSTNLCKPCQKGTYGNKSKMVMCDNCPAGTYNDIESSTSFSSCLACPAGAYCLAGCNSSSGSGSCTAGSFSTAGGGTNSSCSACPRGRYCLAGCSSSSGSGVCGAGSFSTLGSGTTAECSSCPAGTYNENSGSTALSACLACPAGAYCLTRCNSSAGSGLCLPGTFSRAGSDTCTSCPNGTTNSVDRASCLSCFSTSFENLTEVSCFPCSLPNFEFEDLCINPFRTTRIVQARNISLHFPGTNITTIGNDFFIKVRNFLTRQLNVVFSFGIGFRHYREGFMGLVMDLILVSKVSREFGFNTTNVNMNSLDVFDTTVHLFPSPDWTYCSSIRTRDECIGVKNHPEHNTISCGWCSLLMACMQGNEGGPVLLLACPSSDWYVPRDYVSSEQSVAVPSLHYQIVLLVFIITFFSVIFSSCLCYTFSTKKQQKTAKFWIPIWARRKSSAYYVDTTMQTWDSDESPSQHEFDRRISALELPAIPQNKEASFRTAVDSFIQNHMDPLKSTHDVQATRYNSRSNRLSASAPLELCDTDTGEISIDGIAQNVAVCDGRTDESLFCALYDNVVLEFKQSL